MPSTDATYAALEVIIGHQFTNKALLEEALTHPSRGRRRSSQTARDYQRLEFLGDAVLGLVVADMLYHLYPEEREGDLAKRKAALVSGAQLVAIAREWQLGDYLHLSSRAAAEGGRDIATNLEDACEALIGALYLDGGMSAARQLIERYWKERAESVRTPPKDPKTTLQEWAQGRGLPLPEYTVVEQTGPAHDPRFTIEVSVEGQGVCSATASSKQKATVAAARAMLKQIKTP